MPRWKVREAGMLIVCTFRSHFAEKKSLRDGEFLRVVQKCVASARNPFVVGRAMCAIADFSSEVIKT